MHRKIHKILIESNPQDQKNQRESVVVFLATSLGRTDPNVDGRRGEFPDYSQDK
jgi:hypothetical protein